VSDHGQEAQAAASSDSKRRNRRVALAIIVPLVLVIALVVGWRIIQGLTVRNAVDIVEAELRDDGSLVLEVASCNGDPAASVLEQNDQQVRVEVVASTTPYRGGQDCLDVVEIALQEPLGERALVDAHTDDEVSVRRPGAD
jgi:hypothetical protein